MEYGPGTLWDRGVAGAAETGAPSLPEAAVQAESLLGFQAHLGLGHPEERVVP